MAVEYIPGIFLRCHLPLDSNAGEAATSVVESTCLQMMHRVLSVPDLSNLESQGEKVTSGGPLSFEILQFFTQTAVSCTLTVLRLYTVCNITGSEIRNNRNYSTVAASPTVCSTPHPDATE